MKRGLFITFEGMDGTGKSTQINLLKDRLAGEGHDVVLLREPGGTSISEKIREIILDNNNSEMCSTAEMMLYAAARAQLVEEVIKPALNSNKIVICDRFLDSSIAYQAFGRKLGDAVEVVNRFAINGTMPDLTIFLRAGVSLGAGRIKNREKDRIEMAPSDFHRRVYEGYAFLEREYPERIVGIDAEDSIENISKKIWDAVAGHREKL